MDIESGKVRITLRMEPDVYAALMELTKENNRSLNNEINARLRDSLINNSPSVLTTTEAVFQQIIREELVAILKEYRKAFHPDSNSIPLNNGYRTSKPNDNVVKVSGG